MYSKNKEEREKHKSKSTSDDEGTIKNQRRGRAE